MVKKIILTAGNAALALGGAWVAIHYCEYPAEARPAEEPLTIRVVGTSALAGPIEAAASYYQAEHPEHRIDFRVADAEESVSQVLGRQSDLALLGRPLSVGETRRTVDLDYSLRTATIGVDGIVLVVHPQIARHLPEIEFASLRGMFIAGTIHSWEQIAPGKLSGPIKLICPPEDDETTSVLRSHLDPQAKSFVESIRYTTRVQDVARSVLEQRDAVGVLPALLPSDGLARLAIRPSGSTGAVRCEEEALRKGLYPLPLQLVSVIGATAPPSAQEFFRYLGSAAGQQTLYEAGMITTLNPAPPPEVTPQEPAHPAAPPRSH